MSPCHDLRNVTPSNAATSIQPTSGSRQQSMSPRHFAFIVGRRPLGFPHASVDVASWVIGPHENETVGPEYLNSEMKGHPRNKAGVTLLTAIPPTEASLQLPIVFWLGGRDVSPRLGLRRSGRLADDLQPVGLGSGCLSSSGLSVLFCVGSGRGYNASNLPRQLESPKLASGDTIPIPRTRPESADRTTTARIDAC